MNKTMKDSHENRPRNAEKPFASDKQPQNKDRGEGGPQDKEHGEGNYKAAREYDQATEKFAKSGKVETTAREAQPRDEREAREMENAEAAGKSRAKGEDPALHKRSR